jgi:hypothetical protein
MGMKHSVGRQNGILDREFNEVFFLNDDRPLSAYLPQADEVSDLLSVRIDDGLALFAGECETIPAESRAVGEVMLRRSDFILTPDRYTYRVLVLAKRYLNGEKYLVI